MEIVKLDPNLPYFGPIGDGKKAHIFPGFPKDNFYSFCGKGTFTGKFKTNAMRKDAICKTCLKVYQGKSEE